MVLLPRLFRGWISGEEDSKVVRVSRLGVMAALLPVRQGLRAVYFLF